LPSNITIAYYINDENQKIDFEIQGPDEKMLHKVKGKGQLFYVFQPTTIGMHKFILDNTRVTNK
jgi:hypothetical protein